MDFNFSALSQSILVGGHPLFVQCGYAQSVAELDARPLEEGGGREALVQLDITCDEVVKGMGREVSGSTPNSDNNLPVKDKKDKKLKL